MVAGELAKKPVSKKETMKNAISDALVQQERQKRKEIDDMILEHRRLIAEKKAYLEE